MNKSLINIILPLLVVTPVTLFANPLPTSPACYTEISMCKENKEDCCSGLDYREEIAIPIALLALTWAASQSSNSLLSNGKEKHPPNTTKYPPEPFDPNDFDYSNVAVSPE